MPEFESIIDQKRPVRILKTLLKKGNIPHALLFTGIEGIGKRAAAITFAKACNCQALQKETFQKSSNHLKTKANPVLPTGPCGQCRSCGKIDSDNHPDIIQIKPHGAFIRISQIRELRDVVSMKPYEARFRVVIIHDAHAMNPSAGNALLKLLEEPPDHNILILISYQTADLLPTIVSRCQQIGFNPISRKKLATLLDKEYGLEPDHAKMAATMAGGSLSQAVSIGQANWINRRNGLLESSGLDHLDTLDRKPLGQRLVFAEKLALDKKNIVDSLEILKTWVRDLMVYKHAPDRIIHVDLLEKIEYVSKRLPMGLLIRTMDAILAAQKDIQANLNARLTLEVMMLKLSKGN